MTPRHSSRARDAGLRQLALTKRWLLAGSLSLTGMLTAVAAHAFPGKTVKPSSAQPTSVRHSGEPSTSHQHEHTQESPSSLKSATKAPESAPAQESAQAEQSEPVQPAPEAPVISGGS